MFTRMFALLCVLVASGCSLGTAQVVVLPNNSLALTATPDTSANAAITTTPPPQTVLEADEATIYPFEDLTNPVLTVASYYNAINLREYERAYGYRENDSATLEEFSAGFADTEHVEAFARFPVRIGAAAGNNYADVPVLLIATHTDGSKTMFVGCLVTHSTNVPMGPEGIVDQDWGIVSDVEALGRSGLRATDSADLTQLETACDPTYLTTSAGPGTIDYQEDPLSTLASYFNALALGDYERAHGYWSGGATMMLDELRARYAGMQDAVLYVRLTTVFGEGAAGSAYISIPTFVIEQRGDAWAITGGCMVLRRSNVPTGDNPEPDPRWWLHSETLTPTGEFDIALATCA